MELPHDPWAILELDRTTATEREVKRAYARLIKVHRPDTAQEAFQRVHQAYQYALAELQQRDQEPLTAPVPLSEPTGFPEATPGVGESPLPEDFAAALAELQLVLHTPEAGSVTASFAKLRNLAVQRPALLPAWEHALLTVFAGQEKLLGQLLDVDDVFCLIQYEQTDLANLAIDHWHRLGLTLRLAQLGSKCGHHTPPLEAPSVVLLQMRLAMLVAFINLAIANRLSNLFYPKLSPQVRDWVMPRVENRISAAKIFETLPLETRRFWEHRMFPDDDATTEWSAESVGPKFRDVLLRCPASWPGYALLSNVMPPVLFDQLVQKYRPSLQRAAPSHHGSARPREKAATPNFLVMFLFLAFMAIKSVSGCHDNDMRRFQNSDLYVPTKEIKGYPPNPALDPRSPFYSPNLQRQVDEIVRKSPPGKPSAPRPPANSKGDSLLDQFRSDRKDSPPPSPPLPDAFRP